MEFQKNKIFFSFLHNKKQNDCDNIELLKYDHPANCCCGGFLLFGKVVLQDGKKAD